MQAPCPMCMVYERQRYAEYVAHLETKQKLEALTKPAWHRLPQNIWLFFNLQVPLLVQLMQRFDGRDLRIQEEGRAATMFLRPARAGEDSDQIEKWLNTHSK